MNKKVALKYGLISGGLIVASWFITLGFDSTDFAGGEIVGYAIMVAALTAVFMGVKSIRDEKGSLSFKEGFLNGLGITLVASVIYVIGWMIYLPAFAPDFADKYGASQVEMVEQLDISEEEKQKQIEDINEWIETYQQPHVMAAVTFTEIFPVGLIVTLISALILKRK
ncbi:Protein of unknown function [Ekhidna lutea]|uniref:DUF4199 domain-containing protein n=1 Tax=Ekhidna lutea TaxID=447679 RepID=A0A239LG21_EKHLU|nr:DUF4199 domain-containing protein [Ekhidna lutea]SNT29607.1 Protein of unknown function [Ekhidna lutea]